MELLKTTYSDFLDKVTSSHLDYLITHKNDSFTIYEPKIKQRIKDKLEIFITEKSINIEELKENIDKKVKDYLKEITPRTQLPITSRMRLAIIINQHHQINIKNIIEYYKEWRSNEGRGILILSSPKHNKTIYIDSFILKGTNEIEEFNHKWIGLKPALIKNTPRNNKRKKPDSGVGQRNYSNIKRAINAAAVDINCNEIYYQTYIDNNNKKLHEFNGNISSLYRFMTEKRGLSVKESVFRKVVSDFIKTYYRKNRPPREITKPKTI